MREKQLFDDVLRIMVPAWLKDALVKEADRRAVTLSGLVREILATELNRINDVDRARAPR